MENKWSKNQGVMSKTKAIEGSFVHIVYFWLKNPDDENDRRSFKESLEGFVDNSDYIVSVFIGTPAKTDRIVVDSTYTFSLMVTFNSKADHDSYQVEQGHLTFIEESSRLWDRVQVYDSISS